MVRPVVGLDPGEYPFLTFFPGVILTAFLAGTGPSVLCAVLSGLTAWYYLVVPFDSFDLDATNAPALILFVMVTAVIIAVLDILTRTAERLRAEQRVSQSLIDQQRTMFAELQHRVANNMAFLSALLHLQRKQVEADPSLATSVIDEAVRRLDIMAKLHRRLHDPSSVDEPLPEYLRALCAQLLELTGARNIVCLVEADDLRLDLTKLTALSLLISELVTNSVKHAFRGDDGGTITVNLRRLPEGLARLEVSDDGPGLPEPSEGQAGLGLQIIRGLASQLQGALKLPSSGPWTVSLVFAADSAP